MLRRMITVLHLDFIIGHYRLLLQFIIKQMSDKKDHDYLFKVILVGLSGVGKSNILLRYTKD